MAKKFTEMRDQMMAVRRLSGTQDAFTVRAAVSSEDPLQGRTWLQNKCPMSLTSVGALAEVLRYLSRGGEHLPGWKEVAKAAAPVAGAVENHHCTREMCSNAGEDFYGNHRSAGDAGTCVR